jgi:hypothetical protein
MKRMPNRAREQKALFPEKRESHPVKIEETRELVRALAALLLEALGQSQREGAADEPEDHG